MRIAMLALVVGWHSFVGGVTLAQSQTATPDSSPAPTSGQQTPAAGQTSPGQPAPPSTVEPSRGLFTPTWRQAQISGRWSSIAGDQAGFQQYQDLRDGVLFTDARYARERPDWLYRVGGDNVGWLDQRLFGTYERTGRFVVSGLWDQIPQFYSVDTRTPYTPAPGRSPLALDDTLQLANQTGQANRTAYVPVATQFDLRERRDIGKVTAVATPTEQIDVKAAFTSTRHTGELPWGASFGFSNDVEVALPYDSRTNDFTLGAEWTNDRGMVRVAYDGSWFHDLDDTLVWDSPLRLNDSTTAPGRGRMALWPSNSAQTVSTAAYVKLPRRTQVTGFVSYALWTNDETLQPFTINTTLPQLTLPRNTAEAEAHVFSTNLNLVSRPATDWRFSARLRRYDYNNETPQALIPQFINYDTSVATSSTGGPEAFANSRTNFDTDATWTAPGAVALTAGYTYNGGGYDFRIFESTGENIFSLKADAVGWQWATFRLRYEIGDRTGSGLDEELLTEIGEQPALRHYDVANRTRNRFTGQVDVMPNESWTLSASLGTGSDDYDDSYFGLQESSFDVFNVAADFQRPNGLGAGATYNYERYSGLQRSRSATPGAQAADPNRDWTADSRERVDYFSIYVTPPRFGRRTEARLSYDYAYSHGNYFYEVVPNGPLPAPSQLPEVFNKLQQLRIGVRHELTTHWVATLSYLYESFDVYDFAFDQSVVDSIVQPSSLVLGYVYRPYTANSVVFGVRYLW